MICIQLDIWNNVTCVSDGNGPWSFKQTFFEDELLRYEDNLGNYWTKEFGDFPYSMIIFENTLESGHSYLGVKISRIIIDGFIKYALRDFWFITHGAMSFTVSSDLVSVAPLSAPTSQIFYIDVTYERKESWLHKINSKINLFMSKIYCIFVTDKLKII